MPQGEGTYNLAVALIDSQLAAGHRDRVALRRSDRQWTYADLASAMNRVGNVLAEIGVEMENRVFVAVDDGFAFASAFFGAIKIGAVPTAHASDMSVAQALPLLAQSRAKVAIVTANSELAQAVADAPLPHLKQVLVAGGDSDAPGSLERAMAAASNVLLAAETTADDVCFWQYTSGTTGIPKAAVHLQRSLAIGARHFGAELLGMVSEDSVLCSVPFQASYWVANFSAILAAGGTVCLQSGPPTPMIIARALRELRPTLLMGTPATYAGLLAIPALDAGTVRVFYSAGEPLPVATAEDWFHKTGQPIIEGMGSTEVTSAYLSNRPDDHRVGCIGRPVQGVEVRLVDEDGQRVRQGEVGRVMVKSESAFAYYWNAHEQTKRILRGDWLLTEDMCAVDAEGYYYYRGRADDMFRSGGIWVSPAEVEAVLNAHEFVAESAVVGVPGIDGHMRPEAYVRLHNVTASPDVDTRLRSHAAERLDRHLRPRVFHFVDGLPRSANGKLLRRLLTAGANKGSQLGAP